MKDFSFLEEKNNKITITEFDMKILKNYIEKENKNLQTQIISDKFKHLKRNYLELSLELNYIENNIEYYFNKPIMKINLKEKRKWKIKKVFNINKNKEENNNYNYNTDN